MIGIINRHIVLTIVAFSLYVFSSQKVAALYITQLSKSASQVRVCLQKTCPSMGEHPFHSGRKIVIYEASKNWVRVSKYIDREKVQLQFPGKFLPERVAMWIPVKDLPENLIETYKSDEQIEEEKEEEKQKKFSFIPRKAAIPTQRPLAFPTEEEIRAAFSYVPDGPPNVATRPGIQLAAALRKARQEKEFAIAQAELKAKIATQAKAQLEAAKAKEEAEARAKAIEQAKAEAEAKAAETASLTQPNEQQRQAKATEVAVEEAVKEVEAELDKPEVETDALGNPIIELPKKLTKKLRDKRLSALPTKPGNGLDKKGVIALRYHALALLDKEECSGIEEGGRSLSLAGWIYIKCKDDFTYRQYQIQ